MSACLGHTCPVPWALSCRMRLLAIKIDRKNYPNPLQLSTKHETVQLCWCFSSINLKHMKLKHRTVWNTVSCTISLDSRKISAWSSSSTRPQSVWWIPTWHFSNVHLHGWPHRWHRWPDHCEPRRKLWRRSHGWRHGVVALSTVVSPSCLYLAKGYTLW